uniref:Peptide-N(4)-(N-acetyl-beta-glucosaminyl)asparagine amidase n=1 Tax=Corethrella appendiculata TaxID=1370023 RepID=U5EUG5_9DIPT
MSTINKKLVINLEENSQNSYIDGVGILLRLLDNIIKDSQNQKFRCIKMDNKIIKEKLLSLSGAKLLLIEIGFVEQDNGQLVLSSNILIATLKKYRDFIAERLEIVKSSPSSSSTSKKVEQASTSEATKSTEVCKVKEIPKLTKTFHSRTAFPRVLKTSNSFLQSLETYSDNVMQYEDKELQAYGLSLIPVETLKLKASENLRKIQKMVLVGKYNEEEPWLTDLLLEELTAWFKSSFFRWINALTCTVCGNEKTQLVNTTVENGTRVENYSCCQRIFKFYRYNDIEKLLQTRSGRCGEFANCFTFFCRCLGFDARFVYFSGDHVWTEVYSHSKRQWIHIDPSENVVNAPLMYEHGWKRSISYAIAFSFDDVQDVTWRYSSDHSKVLSNRTSCSERDLLSTIFLLRRKRQENFSEKHKKYLTKRALLELVELMVAKEPTEDERRGRTSGSLMWRLERGECNNNNFYIFSALPNEKTNKEFNLRYSCSQNLYQRFLKENGTENIITQEKNWETCHYLSENIFRKLEHDWKMVYLARREGTDNASITWKFDFSKDNLTIKSIKFKCETKSYENSKIEIIFKNENCRQRVMNVEDLIGCDKFTISIKMSGGKGDIAWQHTQLFRQGKDSNQFPFELNIKFN